jgi:adhesin transport system outer membrane protein
MRYSVAVALAAGLLWSGQAHAQAKISLEQAIRKAVATNPRIGEAAANRRAVDHEVRQAQGKVLPQVRVSGEFGSERYRRFDGLRAAGANDWRKVGGETSVTVSQLLFDGFATVNQIYRQMARSDAAAWRTFERAELVALDTAESFLDILRYSASVNYATQNVGAHERLANNVATRFSGGRAGRGDSEQVRERLQAAQAVRAELLMRLEEAKAAFRRSVGVDPLRLGGASRLGGLPRNRQEALAQVLAANPTLRAAASDVTAAERDYDSTKGLFGPRISLEGRGTSGSNSSNTVGHFDEMTGKVRADWLIFSGGSDLARRNELSERVAENRLRMDSLRRSAFESVDRAWGVRAHSGTRIGALQAQVNAAQQVVIAYRGEYELGQRTLLDLLNAENALFNARLSLEAAKSVAIFSDYQLLATTGQLLARLNIARPGESRLRPATSRGIFPSLTDTTDGRKD